MANRGFCSEEVKPLHVFAQPDRQRSSGPERGVVGSPGGGLVAGLWPFGPLMRRGHQRNQVGLCNKALPAQRGRFVQQSLAQLRLYKGPNNFPIFLHRLIWICLGISNKY